MPTLHGPKDVHHPDVTLLRASNTSTADSSMPIVTADHVKTEVQTNGEDVKDLRAQIAQLTEDLAFERGQQDQVVEQLNQVRALMQSLDPALAKQAFDKAIRDANRKAAPFGYYSKKVADAGMQTVAAAGGAYATYQVGRWIYKEVAGMLNNAIKAIPRAYVYGVGTAFKDLAFVPNAALSDVEHAMSQASQGATAAETAMIRAGIIDQRPHMSASAQRLGLYRHNAFDKPTPPLEPAPPLDDFEGAVTNGRPTTNAELTRLVEENGNTEGIRSSIEESVDPDITTSASGRAPSTTPTNQQPGRLAAYAGAGKMVTTVAANVAGNQVAQYVDGPAKAWVKAGTQVTVQTAGITAVERLANGTTLFTGAAKGFSSGIGMPVGQKATELVQGWMDPNTVGLKPGASEAQQAQTVLAASTAAAAGVSASGAAAFGAGAALGVGEASLASMMSGYMTVGPVTGPIGMVFAVGAAAVTTGVMVGQAEEKFKADMHTLNFAFQQMTPEQQKEFKTKAQWDTWMQKDPNEIIRLAQMQNPNADWQGLWQQAMDEAFVNKTGPYQNVTTQDQLEVLQQLKAQEVARGRGQQFQDELQASWDARVRQQQQAAFQQQYFNEVAALARWQHNDPYGYAAAAYQFAAMTPDQQQAWQGVVSLDRHIRAQIRSI